MPSNKEKIMPQVTVYSGPFCPFCTKAKALLDKRNVDYVEYNVKEDELLTLA